MDIRVYFGEYSLKRWSKMMLSKNIFLAEYERSFVWHERYCRDDLSVSLRTRIIGLLPQDMREQFFMVVLAGYLGANFMSGPITEWQIDVIKENISNYCEATIVHS